MAITSRSVCSTTLSMRRSSSPSCAMKFWWGCPLPAWPYVTACSIPAMSAKVRALARSEEHTSELQSHSDLHSFPTRRSSDLAVVRDEVLVGMPIAGVAVRHRLLDPGDVGEGARLG